jgi:hypothetical protein
MRILYVFLSVVYETCSGRVSLHMSYGRPPSRLWVLSCTLLWITATYVIVCIHTYIYTYIHTLLRITGTYVIAHAHNIFMHTAHVHLHQLTCPYISHISNRIRGHSEQIEHHHPVVIMFANIYIYIYIYITIVIWNGTLWFWSVIKTIMTDYMTLRCLSLTSSHRHHAHGCTSPPSSCLPYKQSADKTQTPAHTCASHDTESSHFTTLESHLYNTRIFTLQHSNIHFTTLEYSLYNTRIFTLQHSNRIFAFELVWIKWWASQYLC